MRLFQSLLGFGTSPCTLSTSHLHFIKISSMENFRGGSSVVWGGGGGGGGVEHFRGEASPVLPPLPSDETLATGMQSLFIIIACPSPRSDYL